MIKKSRYSLLWNSGFSLFVSIHLRHNIGKVFFGYDCIMAHTQTIVVYGLWRVMQKLGYADAIGYTHTNKGIYSKLGC